jgi:hypothetical protein
VAENQRGGCLGDGNEGAMLGRGRARQTARGGRKRSVGGRWLGFKGSGGEGRRGGRHVEAEREREREIEGAIGVAWSSAVAHCGAIGGPGRDEGPIISGWVQRSEAVGAGLTGGVGSTVRPIRFSN